MNIARTAGTLVYRALALVLLFELTSHVYLASRALAIMALGGQQQQQQRRPRSVVPASVIDGGDTEQKRFNAGSLKLPDGTTVMVLEDLATKVVVYITPQGAAAAHVPSCESSDEDESLEDTGIRMARKEIR